MPKGQLQLNRFVVSSDPDSIPNHVCGGFTSTETIVNFRVQSLAATSRPDSVLVLWRPTR